MRFWWLSGSNMGEEHHFSHIFGGRHVWKVSLLLEKKSLPNLAGHGKGAADVIPFQMTKQANFFRNLSIWHLTLSWHSVETKKRFFPKGY